MKNILRSKAKKPGLTLIEVIISVALLAILSIPVLVAVNTNVKLSQKTELSQQATVIGQRILEYLSTMKNITLEDSSVLQDLDLDLSFSKGESGVISTNGKTKQGFDLEIELVNLIKNESNISDDSTLNNLMQNPQFIISEIEGNKLTVNNRVMSNNLTLIIEDLNNVKLCDTEYCISTTYENNQIPIVVNDSIKSIYEVPVINNSDGLVKIYLQFDANEAKNIKFKKESGDLSVSYLTKMAEVSLDEDESMITEINDLYEINVHITTPKVKGTLFEGNMVTNLNVYEFRQEGE